MKWWSQHSRWSLSLRQRRLVQATLTGLAVAGVVLLIQWGGLFSSAQVAAADYLYESRGDPGDDIVIIAIDDASQQILGDWPWPFTYYEQLFERLGGADVVGFDVLLSDAGLYETELRLDNPDATALADSVRRAGNAVMPLASLELSRPRSPGELYSVGQIVAPFPALRDAATDEGVVVVVLDGDNTLRRVPLLVSAGNRVHEAFSLRIVRRRLALGGAPVSLRDSRVVIGNEQEIKYQVVTDAHGAMLVNFVGGPNTFPVYSFADVIRGQVEASVFAGKIVLVGMMNAVGEMDVHQTPTSGKRMSGIEFQANVIHTLLNHRALTPQAPGWVILTVAVLALVSSVVLSQLGALVGAAFIAALTLGYFLLTNMQFDGGVLPNVLLPYATIPISYAVVMAVRFASERVERNRVADVFGRFVSAEVRDSIVNMALDDPDLIRPGGRLMDISVMFADIRGFTTMSETLSPQEVVEVLNLYLNSMEEQVFEQGGTIDKYTGDGMMVLFGAPLEQPDHAERAVRAALAMQRAAAEIGRGRRDLKCAVAYGIGITTGPAVVGQIGSRRRLDYTAIGDTVNLASRLEGKAPPGDILISQATCEVLKDIVLAEALEPMMVKGKAEPVVAYRVLGMRDKPGEKPA